MSDSVSGASLEATGAECLTEAEVAKLRKELAKAKMERDIVKKAAAYFAREPLPSTRS